MLMLKEKKKGWDAQLHAGEQTAMAAAAARTHCQIPKSASAIRREQL